MKSLKNLLLSIPLIAGLVFSSINSQAQTKPRMIVNPWSQPHKTLNHYGSGDVNKDSTINWNDYSAIDFTSNDESDIDGQIPSSSANDKNILNNYLSKTIAHLPSQWNVLTNSEKNNWFSKMTEIDSTEYIDSANWSCGHYALQTELDFAGPEIQNPAKFDEVSSFSRKNLGKFNLPVYSVDCHENINGDAHSFNAILIGDDIRNFNDWRFFDNSPWVVDMDVKPGDWSMNKTTYLEIESIQYYDKDGIARGPPPFIKFWLKDGQADSVYVSQYETVLKDPRYDKKAPNINASIKEGETYPKLSQLEINASDDYSFLDSLRYSFDNANWKDVPCSKDIFISSVPIYSISKTENVSLGNGNHNLKVYVSDIAGNDTLIERNFTITDIPEIKKSYETSVYPNPTNGNVTFEYSGAQKDVLFKLYNSQGQKLEDKLIKENKFELDLSKYSNGIYFYNLNGKTGKVVKE